jgi:GNAT superfamily N-acetyltransferase
MKDNEFKFKPVGKTNWKDLEKLFESKGAPGYCWCMPWRNMDEGGERASSADKKKSLKKYVTGKTPIGLLAYHSSEPVAWCSIGPRDSFRDLGGDDTLEDVWSLVCFYIKREFRGQGLSEQLAKEAFKYAKKKGAKYVEAYPVNPDSPSYRFMGFKPTFEKLGFDYKHKAGSRRNVMALKL